MTSPLPALHLQELDASRIDPDALEVLRRLHEHGHRAWLVGGCVRDLLVGRTPKDFDVVSSASAREVRALFPQSVGFGGRRFLIVQVRTAGGRVIEVARFRARIAPELGEPDTRVIPDEALEDFQPELGTLEQDAWARDFTVNALYYDVVHGTVIDPLDARSDLQANRLRIVGDPEAHLRDDPSILLRGARFATRLGMELEPHTAEAMARLGGELSRCSRHRLLVDTLRGLGNGAGAPFLRLLDSLGCLPVLLPPVARHLEGGPEVARRFFAHVEAVDRFIASGQRLNELLLASALLLPVTAPADGVPPPPEAMAAVLGELTRGAPELAALPGHGQLLITTLHGVLKSPEAVAPGNPLLPDARRLAALLASAREANPPIPGPPHQAKPTLAKESHVAGGMDVATKVSSLAARLQEILKSPGPESNPPLVSWLKEVESALPLVTDGAAAKLGPHAASADNLRLTARTTVERLLNAPWLTPETKAELSGFLERTPAYRQVGKYRFSSDWMSKCEEDWRRLLAPLVGVPGLRALEIGSFEGRSAIWLLENVLTHPTSRITCVDLFAGDYVKRFEDNLAASGAADRVEKRAGRSTVVLRQLPPEPTYDLVYIDGSHLAFDVLEDAVLSWRLVKPGGLVIFDDYGMAAQQFAARTSMPRPDIGIDAFLSAAVNQFELLHKDFQLTIRKNPA